MTQAYARILARYLAGALVAYGIITPADGAALALDPDLALLIGAAMAGLTELAYGLARSMGWRG